MVLHTLVMWQKRRGDDLEPRLKKVKGLFHKNELNAR